MAMTADRVGTQHPFLDGGLKKMLIDGQWVEAASGKTFESVNPATGEVLATVAEGDAEDINRAVAAARRAFEGPWSKFKPYERQALLLKLADLVEQHFDELALLDTLDMGAPISRDWARAALLGMLRYYAGMATSLHGETIDNSLPGRDLLLHAQGAGRRRRRDHPVERAAQRRRSGSSARRSPPAARWCSSRPRRRRSRHCASAS